MMSAARFNLCCTKLADALKGDAPRSDDTPSFRLKVEADGVLFYRIGGFNAQTANVFTDPVLFCPFCGVRRQDFDAAGSHMDTIREMDLEEETVWSFGESEETILAAAR